jgi:threonine dehydratase
MLQQTSTSQTIVLNQNSLPVSKQMIDDAFDRIKNVVKQTTLDYSERLSHKYGAAIYIKRED